MAPPLHRRFALRPQAPVPRLGPGSQYDARAFGPAYEGFFQADQVQRERLVEQFRGGLADLADVQDDLDARNLPPQLKQAKKLAVITAFGVAGAQLLIPQNPQRRFSFIVSNFMGINDVLFSYGKPIDVGGGIGEGIPLGGAYYQEANGSCSIDDIWVFCNDSTASNYPFFICGYEGGIEITGNRK